MQDVLGALVVVELARVEEANRVVQAPGPVLEGEALNGDPLVDHPGIPEGDPLRGEGVRHHAADAGHVGEAEGPDGVPGHDEPVQEGRWNKEYCTGNQKHRPTPSPRERQNPVCRGP